MKKGTLLLILGNLASFGPFVTDLYLPSLPALAQHFSTTPSMVQMSLTASMIGLAAGQLFFGPISDKYGRLRPLLLNLTLFVIATAGCIVFPDINGFIICRLLQGLTGASGLVISKAMVADMYTGQEMGRLFAILTSIQFISPIVAPVLGGVILGLTAWQGIFIVLGIWGLILLYAGTRLTETLPVEKRLQLPVSQSLKAFAPLLRNRRFMIMNLLQAFVGIAFFSYISASPFLFQSHFGLSSINYSIIFAFNASGLIIGSMLVLKLQRQESALIPGSIFTMVTCALTSISLLAGWPLIAFEASLFLMIFSCGLLIPIGNSLALDSAHKNRGSAAALLGAIAFLVGGLVAPMVCIGNMMYSTIILFMAGAAISLSLCIYDRHTSKYRTIK